jgi:glycosyltransferase involved in cell wall biosynthesis
VVLLIFAAKVIILPIIMPKMFVNARFLTQPVSGVQRYGIECSRQLKKINPEAAFLSPKNIIHKDIAAELNVTVTGNRSGQYWEQIELPSYLNKNGQLPLLSLANAAPLSYKNNFITIHDLAFHHYPEWNSGLFSKWYSFLIPRLAKRSRHIFTVSDTIRRELAGTYGLPDEKISVTGNGLSANILSCDRKQCTDKQRIILAVGSFNTRKNHHRLIRAYLASNIRETYRLVIVGDKHKVFSESGIDESLIRNSNIDIRERLTDNELMALYCQAQIVVSISMYEGFGIPVLEGLYFGCKVLCSDIPVYRELYNGYVYFCDPYQAGDITSSLEQIAADHIKAKEILPLLYKYSYEGAAKVINDQINRPDTNK